MCCISKYIFLTYFKNIYSFIFLCLHPVLVAACRIFGCRLSSCGTQAQLPQGMWDLSSLTRDWTHIPCTARWILNHWTAREVPSPTVSLHSVACAADPSPTALPLTLAMSLPLPEQKSKQSWEPLHLPLPWQKGRLSHVPSSQNNETTYRSGCAVSVLTQSVVSNSLRPY